MKNVLLPLMLTLFYEAESFLNLDELKHFNYEVDILSTPVRIGEEQKHSVMLMTSRFGQEYQCSLPDKKVISETTDSSQADSEVISVKKLLEPLHNAPCLTKTKSWWTYELCYGQYIKQFHVENGKAEGPVLYLGLYDSDFDWNNDTSLNKWNKTGLQKYHSQYYNHGTKCDITGSPRKAEVRYYCEEDAADYIYGVEEPETCSYVFIVHTSRVCSFPPLKPPPSSRPHLISCSPLLSEEQYQQYLDKVEEEKKAAQEKRKLWLQSQQKNLESIKASAAKKKLDDISVESEDGKVEAKESTDETAHTEKSKEDEETVETSEGSAQKIDGKGVGKDAGEDDDDDLIQEFDQELEKMPEQFKNRLYNYKDDLRKGITKEFNNILNEAQDELEEELDDPLKDSAYAKLASTLNRLLERLDKGEQDEPKKLPSEDVQTESVASDIKEEKKKQKVDTEEDEEEEEVEEEKETTPDDAEAEDSTGSKKNVFDDGKVRVRIRRVDRKSMTETSQKGQFKEQELATSERAKLEDALKAKLQKAGLDTAGRKIEVKIITAGFYDEDEDGKTFQKLSDEETQQFQNMIVTLLMGNQEAMHEMERHQRLEKNYQYVWGQDTLPVKEEEEDR